MRHGKVNPPALAAALGILWLGIFPLWQDLSYAHITRAKWAGALALCGVSVAAAMLMVLSLWRKKQLGRELRWHPVQLAAAAYFLWLSLSGCFGSWAGQLNGDGQAVVLMGAIRYEGLVTQWCYGLIFAVMSLFPAREEPVLAGASAALTIFCGVVALQYTGMNVLGLFPEGRSINTNYEFQGTIGNIDMVSGYLCLVTPLLLGAFATRERGGWHMLASGALGAAVLWCIEVQSGLIALLFLSGLVVLLMLRFPAYRARGCAVLAAVMAGMALRGMLFLPWLDSATPREALPVELTFTTQAAIGLAAAVMLSALAGLFGKRPGKAVPVRVILCLVLAAAVAVVCGVVYLPIPESAGGLYELHEILNGRPQDHFGSWRLGAWRYSLSMSKASPVFGTGPDTFYYAMFSYLQQAGVTLGESFDNPHNEYVAILSNNGIPALAAYVALLAWVLIALCRWKQWPLALSIGCFALQGIFSFSICLVTPMFWTVLGMAAARCGKPFDEQSEVN